jgi:hypothetical protein
MPQPSADRHSEPPPASDPQPSPNRLPNRPPTADGRPAARGKRGGLTAADAAAAVPRLSLDGLLAAARERLGPQDDAQPRWGQAAEGF